jgi:hypothetical protein
LVMTVQELSTPGLFESVGEELAPNKENIVLLNLVRDIKTLTLLSGLAEIGDDPASQVFLRKKIHVCPPKERNILELVEARAKPGYKPGSVLPVVVGSDGDKLFPIANALFNYSHMFSGNMEITRALFKKYAPKLVLESPNLIRGNWYKQLSDHLAMGNTLVHVTQSDPELVMLALNETSTSIVTDVREIAMKGIEPFKPEAPFKYELLPRYPTIMWTGTLDDLRKDQVIRMVDPIKGPREGRKSIYSSVLSSGAKRFLKDSMFDGNEHLKGAIASFLREFSSEALQDVALDMIKAKIVEVIPEDDLDSDGSKTDEDEDY